MASNIGWWCVNRSVQLGKGRDVRLSHLLGCQAARLQAGVAVCHRVTPSTSQGVTNTQQSHKLDSIVVSVFVDILFKFVK